MEPNSAQARCLKRAVRCLDQGGNKNIDVRDGATWQERTRDLYWDKARMNDYMARVERRFNELYDESTRRGPDDVPGSETLFTYGLDPELQQYYVDKSGRLKRVKRVSFDSYEHRHWIHGALRAERVPPPVEGYARPDGNGESVLEDRCLKGTD